MKPATRGVIPFAFALSACANAQSVTIVEAPSSALLEATVPFAINIVQGPILFNASTTNSVPNVTASYTATKSHPEGPVDWIRFEPVADTVGSSMFGDNIASVIIDLWFTTPSPGPAYTITTAAASLNTGPTTGLCIIQFTHPNTLTNYALENVSCTPGQSCVLVDSAVTPPAVGSWTGTLQGGLTYRLTIAWVAQSTLGETSAIAAPLTYDLPFFQIDFTTSADRLCADQNQDGQITPADFNTWILNYNANNLLADVNQDQVLTPADFNAWILAYNQGLAGPYCTP